MSRPIKYGIAFLILIALFWIVDVHELIKVFKNLTAGMIVFLMLISVLLVYASALKWELFLEALGSPMPVLKLFNYYLIGYFVNLLAPSYIGGDVTRSWFVGKKAGQHNALAATILERYTGFVAMLALGVVFASFVSIVPLAVKQFLWFLVLATAALTVLCMSPRALNVLRRWDRLQAHMVKLQTALLFAKKNHRVLWQALGLSFLFHLVAVLNTLAAAYAVGWTTVPVQGVFVVLPIILIIGALPIAPSGLGIQEGAFYYFLQALGATPEQALGVGLVLRAKSYVLALWGGGVWLIVKNTDKETQERANTSSR